jgi:hypothetical protein
MQLEFMMCLAQLVMAKQQLNSLIRISLNVCYSVIRRLMLSRQLCLLQLQKQQQQQQQQQQTRMQLR